LEGNLFVKESNSLTRWVKWVSLKRLKTLFINGESYTLFRVKEGV
jgi:hypothetical protein